MNKLSRWLALRPGLRITLFAACVAGSGVLIVLGHDRFAGIVSFILFVAGMLIAAAIGSKPARSVEAQARRIRHRFSMVSTTFAAVGFAAGALDHRLLPLITIPVFVTAMTAYVTGDVLTEAR